MFLELFSLKKLKRRGVVVKCKYKLLIMLMLNFINMSVSCKPVSPEKKKAAGKLVEGKSLSDLYGKFSSQFRTWDAKKIKETLELLKNKELISNANKKQFEKLVKGTSDNHDVLHEIFIYFGAFPLSDEAKQKEGIRTSIAQTFQELVLGSDPEKFDKELIAADVQAMADMEAYLLNKENEKKKKLPVGLLPQLPKSSKKVIGS